MADDFKALDLTTVYDDPITTRPFDLSDSSEIQTPKYISGADLSNIARIDSSWKDPKFTIPSASAQFKGRDLTKVEEAEETYITAIVDTIANIPENAKNVVAQNVLEMMDKPQERRVEMIKQLREQYPDLDTTDFIKKISPLIEKPYSAQALEAVPYNPQIIDTLEGREYPRVKWAQDTIANATKAVNDRKLATALVAARRGIEQDALSNRAAEILGDMTPIIAAGYGAGTIAGALGAAPATAQAIATGAAQATTFVDMSGQYAYDTAQKYLERTGDSDFRDFTPNDAKGLSALAYGTIGTAIEFGFGGVEPLLTSAFTKAGIEQSILSATGKVAVGEAWEEFLQEWEEFLMRKMDGTNDRTWGQALKDSLKTALWGGFIGGATGGIVYRTNRRNATNILTQMGIPYDDAQKVVDIALSDVQNNIQENADTALSIKNKTGEPYTQLRTAVDDAIKVVEEQGRRVVRPEEREEFIDGIVDNWGSFALNQAGLLNMTINDFLSDIQPRFENGEIRMYQPGYMSPQYTYDRLQDIEKRIANIEEGIATESENEKYEQYKKLAGQLRKINSVRLARERTAAKKALNRAADVIEKTPLKTETAIPTTEPKALPQVETPQVKEYSDADVLGMFSRALLNKQIQLGNWEDVRWSSLNSAGDTYARGKRTKPATEAEKAKFARKMLDKYTPDWNKPTPAEPVQTERTKRATKDAKKVAKGAYTIDDFFNSLPENERTQAGLEERFNDALMSWIIDDPKLFDELMVQNAVRGAKIVEGVKAVAQPIVQFNMTAPEQYRFIDQLRMAMANYILNYGVPDISAFYRSNDMIGQGGFDSNTILYIMRESAAPSGISEFLSAYIDGVVKNQETGGEQARSEILSENVEKAFPSKKGTEEYNSLFTQFQQGATYIGEPIEETAPTIPMEQFDLADENARLDDIYPAYEGETIEIDGKERTIYNSTGERIAKSAEALRNFWRWFGDSKVVDEQGRPLVVYHGTNNVFDTFDIEKSNNGVFGKGFYFAFDDDEIPRSHGNIIMPVYLRIENPIYSWEEIKHKGYREQKWTVAQIRKEMQTSNKYDGVSGYEELFVKDPTQIKSVDNRGTYDIQDPNIYYDRSPAQWRGLFNMIRGAVAISGSVKASTIQHELAHFWLDNMWNRYKSGKYTQDWFNNFSAIAKWLGLNLDAEYISTPAHEQFARGYEAFISGRTISDTPGIKPAFNNYDKFVRRVYKTARDIRYRDTDGKMVNPVFTKEAFDAFDRLLQVPDGVQLAQNAEIAPKTKEEKDTNAKNIKNSIAETRKKIDEAQQARQKENPSDVPILRTTGYAKDVEGKVKRSKNGYYIVSTQEGQQEKALALIKSNPQLAESIIWGGANETDIDRGVLARAYANYIQATDPAKAELVREYEITTISRSAAKTLSHIPRNDLYRSAARQILAQKTRNIAQANYGLSAGMVEEFEKDLENRVALAWEAVKNAPLEQRQAIAQQQIKEIVADFSTVDDVPEVMADTDFTQVNERTFTEMATAQIRRMLGLTLTQDESEKLELLVEKIEDTMQGDSWERQHYLTLETAQLLRQYSEFIAGYTPQGFYDKLTKLYYPASMLFNIPTHMKNMITNTFQQVASVLSVARSTTQIEIPMEQLKNDAEYDIKLYVKTGFMPSVMTDITSPQQVLGEKRMILENPNWFDTVAEKSLNWLSIEDSVFKSLSFYRELAIMASQQARKEGLTGKALKARALELYREGRALRGQTEWGIETRAVATEIAKVDTFVGSNNWTRFMKSARNTINLVQFRGRSLNLGNILSPFIVVGTNIVRGGFNLTGLPIASGIAVDIFHPQTRINDTKVSELIDLDVLSEKQARALFRGGKINQRVAKTLIAEGQITEEELKGLTYTERFGTATTRGLAETGVAWLAIIGMLAALGDDDWMPEYDDATSAEKARAKAEGIQFGSIRIGNTWVSTDLFGYLKYPITWAMNTRRFGATAIPEGMVSALSDLPVVSDAVDLWRKNKYNKTTQDYLLTLGDTILDKFNGMIPGVINNAKRIAQKSGKLPTIKLKGKGDTIKFEKTRDFDMTDIVLYSLFGQAISKE